ncbi:HD domain-containing protein [bacterium]|nr:HD domain-containing protein [candidate division CSSED10-310 bacterium]
MSDVKMTITDPVYGAVPLSALQADLIQTVEIQRLNSIHQLGMTFQVYPSAHSMRFSHALGVSHLAHRMGQELIQDNDRLPLSSSQREYQQHILIAAGLLHDICHTPWSHTLEPLFIEVTGRDHMDMTHDLLCGNTVWPLKGAGRIPEILADHGIRPQDVSRLIAKQYTDAHYLQQLIFGEVDADTLDYLCRDFTSTGVSFGHIDIDRLIRTMVVRPDRLYFQAKGLQAVRDFLNARVEMYSAVYFHKKTRIADCMCLRAARCSVVERHEFPDFWLMTDDEFLSALMTQSGSDYVRDIAWRLKYRQDLFKRVYHIESGAVSSEQKRFLSAIGRMAIDPRVTATRLEMLIAAKLDIPAGYVIVDHVAAAADVSESRFRELDILFLDKDGSIRTLPEMDRPFDEYIRRAQPSRSLLSVYAPATYRERCMDRLPDVFRQIVGESGVA